MPKQVKYIKVKKGWWTGHVNEEDLARVIEEAQREGWVYEGLEDHGWALDRKWVARFSKES
jgi:hypothetical protein